MKNSTPDNQSIGRASYNMFSKSNDHKAMLLGVVLLSGAMLFASGAAFAQTDGSAQQLPNDFANQQIPPAFPDPESVPSTQAPSTDAASQNTSSPATSSDASASNPTTDQASTQSPASVPAEPAQKQLVPATPMGTAAQSAANGQGGQDTQPASFDPEAAANGDNVAATANPQEDEVTPPPSIMDEYTTTPSGDQTGDALPSVNRLNMVKLTGEGFGNAAAKNVSVPVDPSMGTDGKNAAELQEEIRTEAFDAAITGMFPLKPDQIEALLKKYDETQRAVESPTFNNPKPEVSVQNISLDPGVAPPVVRTAVGNVTTLNILDVTGAPWPVQDVTWAGDYEIVEPEQGGHIIRITPMSHFARGNIVIRLLTLKTPLTMTLETGREVVQYRVDARVPEYGPFASTPLMQGGKSLVAGDPELTAILDGSMPSGLSKLQVTGVDGRTTAYASGDKTYVRTPLTLLSPAWQSSISSADGMNVYALGTAPVLLLSDSGEFVRATLSEKKDLLDE